MLGDRHSRRDRTVRPRAGTDRFWRYHGRAGTGAGRALGPSRALGDAEIPALFGGVRRPEDDAGAVEQCSGTDSVAVRRFSGGTCGVLHRECDAGMMYVSQVSESRPGAPPNQSAASASDCPGKRPAYLVIPTMVNTLVKCGDRP